MGKEKKNMGDGKKKRGEEKGLYKKIQTCYTTKA